MSKSIISSFVVLALAWPCILPAAPPVWEPNYGPQLQLYDNDCAYVALSFPFDFYGETYTGVWVNSNGNVTFDGCNTRFSDLYIPEALYRIVAPLYGDFNPDTRGGVHAQVLGAPGKQRLVVTWREVPPAGLWNGRTLTFQLQLFEGTHAILFGYNGLQTLGYNRDGSPMVAGISSGPSQFVRSAEGDLIRWLDHNNICYVPSGLGYKEMFGACELTITVTIDVKPGSWPNPINTRSKGVVPVAILGAHDFSVLDVDPASLRFGPAAASPAHDLSNPDVLAEHLQDTNGDGRLDLVAHYRVQATGLSAGDTVATLEGETYGGLAIEGSDGVRVK